MTGKDVCSLHRNKGINGLYAGKRRVILIGIVAVGLASTRGGYNGQAKAPGIDSRTA
jgi:hypothetical protein